MTREKPKSLAELGCTTFVTVGDAHVAFADGVQASFDALDDKAKGRFRRIMEMWCHGHKLTPEMFNYNEGRSPQKNRMIQALKAFKIRFYGFDHRVLEGRAFIIVEHDPAKKRDKADPKILDRAKNSADNF